MEEVIKCTGKNILPLIIGIWLLFCGVCFVAFFIRINESMLLIVYSVICFRISLHEILYWCNKKIILKSDEIIYISLLGKESRYLWSDVKGVSYRSTVRSAPRILIQTDKKICLDCDMTNYRKAENVLKKRGYLDVSIK